MPAAHGCMKRSVAVGVGRVHGSTVLDEQRGDVCMIVHGREMKRSALQRIARVTRLTREEQQLNCIHVATGCFIMQRVGRLSLDCRRLTNWCCKTDSSGGTRRRLRGARQKSRERKQAAEDEQHGKEAGRPPGR